MSNSSLVFSILLSFFFVSYSHKNSSTFPGHYCLPYESSALLQLRREFTINCSTFEWECYPKTQSWKSGENCCLWDGVTCDRKTAHVIALDLSNSCLHGTLSSNSSLFHLYYLRTLDLSLNNFGHSTIPVEMCQLSSLTHLNLSSSMFYGPIPQEITRLNKLVSLSLGHSPLSLKKGGIESLAQNLTNLKVLEMDGVFISSATPKSLLNLSSLTSLSLYGCDLRGEFPMDIFHLPNIKAIGLGQNALLNGFLPEFNATSSLRFLDLSWTGFSGDLPYSIGSLKLLEYLNLSFGNLSGVIPSSIGNLTNLRYLHLSSSNFGGYLPSSLGNLASIALIDISNNTVQGRMPSSIGNLTNLLTLDFSSNRLSGKIPPCLFSFSSLEELYLNHNQLTGPLTIQNVSSSNLKVLSLSKNKLEGSIPRSISKLSKLSEFYISKSLSGLIELDVIFLLKNLSAVSLSGNYLKMTNASDNFTLPQLQRLSLGSCSLRKFPEFLKTQEKLEVLDLSSNIIEGPVPSWFWNVSVDTLSYLNLSHNSLTSLEQAPLTFPWKGTNVMIDFRSNMLQGSLPIPSMSTVYFTVSNNSFSGSLSPLICESKSLQFLDVSYNKFGGPVPPCICNFSSSLSVLDLRNNNLQGDLPQDFTNMSSLRMLDLSNNQLKGKVPQSLTNCKRLEIVNLANNYFNDTFPFWLKKLPQLKVLVLRSNLFHGSIWDPRTNFGFSSLRIIDLSYNNFSGSIPSKYFRNWDAMIEIHDEDTSQQMYMGDKIGLCQDSMTLVYKGREMKMVRILTIFTTIDLSYNKFHGRIPYTLGTLQSLHSLRLSGNSFSGHIPTSLGNITQLEALDLSQNFLSGGIPPQLANLNFLGVLNLSYNQLVGPIPPGGQMSTFPSSSFEGNQGLCGIPLSKQCGEIDMSSEKRQGRVSGYDIDWNIAPIGCACGVVIGVSIGYMIDTRRLNLWVLKASGIYRQRRR